MSLLSISIASLFYSVFCALFEFLARDIFGYIKVFDFLQSCGIPINQSHISIIRISAFIALALFLISAFIIKKLVQWDFCIFQDFSDCQRIEKCMDTNAIITSLTPSECDKNIIGLHYTECYCVTFSSPNINFTLYSYAFSNQRTALKYFWKTTRIPLFKPYHNWVWISPGTWKICHINNNNVYVLHVPDNQTTNVEEFLKKCYK